MTILSFRIDDIVIFVCLLLTDKTDKMNFKFGLIFSIIYTTLSMILTARWRHRTLRLLLAIGMLNVAYLKLSGCSCMSL